MSVCLRKHYWPPPAVTGEPARDPRRFAGDATLLPAGTQTLRDPIGLAPGRILEFATFTDTLDPCTATPAISLFTNVINPCARCRLGAPRPFPRKSQCLPMPSGVEAPDSDSLSSYQCFGAPRPFPRKSQCLPMPSGVEAHYPENLSVYHCYRAVGSCSAENSMFINVIRRRRPRLLNSQLLSMLCRAGTLSARVPIFINALRSRRPLRRKSQFLSLLSCRRELFCGKLNVYQCHPASTPATNPHRRVRKPATCNLQPATNLQLSTNLQPATIRRPLPVAGYNLK